MNAGSSSVSVLLGDANNITVEGTNHKYPMATTTSETNFTDFGNVVTNLHVFYYPQYSSSDPMVNSINLAGQMPAF